jgi:hypothetical protein
VPEAGVVAVYRGSVDFETRTLASTDADLLIRGAMANGHLGQAVGATDRDGNGRLDLIIGEPDNGAGNVYIIPDSLIASRMKPKGTSTPGLITVTETGLGILKISGETPGDRFGASLSSRSFDTDGDSRGDLLVGSPARSGPRTSFFDSFDDGEWSMGPAWTSHSGHWRIETGKLRQVKSGTESISTPSTQAFGTWTVTMNHGTDSSSLNSVMRFYFMATDGAFGPGSSTAKGYYLFSNSIYSPDLVRLYRDDGGTVALLASTQVTLGTADRTFKITRYDDGHFHVFMGSAKILEAADTTYATAKFMGFLNTADTSSASVFIDSVKAYPLNQETLFDDFGDENFNSNPQWTKFGTIDWTVTQSLALQQATASTSASARLSASADVADGTWSIQFRHGTDSGTTNSVLRYYLYFKDANDPGDTTAIDGYYLFSNSANDLLSIVKQVNGATTTLVSTTWADDTLPHAAKVVRDQDNYWQLYLDGQFRADVTETTSTGAITPPGPGMRIGFRNQADTASAIVQIDDVKYPKGPTQHGAAYVFLSGETLNNRNAGSADVIRYGDRNNDHHGSAVAASDLADLLIGAPDADFANQPPDSGLAEFVRGSSMEKVAFFEDFDGTTRGTFTGSWGPPPGPASEWELGTPVQSADVPDNPNGDHTKGPGGGGKAWGTDLDSFYSLSFGDQDLLSPTIDLSGYASARLVLWHAYWVEANFDFVRVYASSNGGSTFTEVYSATDHSPQEPPLTGAIQWVRLVVNLDDYAGSSQLKLRFRLDQDSSVVANGWYVDDMMIVAGGSGGGAPQTLTGSLGEHLGYAVDFLGDVDLDGTIEAALGAPGFESSRGRVLVHSILDDTMNLTPRADATGEAPGDAFGSAVLSAGLFDSDEAPDFLVGAPNRKRLGASESGGLYVFRGDRVFVGALDPSQALVESFVAGSRGGSSFAKGDFNGFPGPEIASGAPGSSSPFRPGQVFVLTFQDSFDHDTDQALIARDHAASVTGTAPNDWSVPYQVEQTHFKFQNRTFWHGKAISKSSGQPFDVVLDQDNNVVALTDIEAQERVAYAARFGKKTPQLATQLTGLSPESLVTVLLVTNSTDQHPIRLAINESFPNAALLVGRPTAETNQTLAEEIHLEYLRRLAEANDLLMAPIVQAIQETPGADVRSVSNLTGMITATLPVSALSNLESRQDIFGIDSGALSVTPLLAFNGETARMSRQHSLGLHGKSPLVGRIPVSVFDQGCIRFAHEAFRETDNPTDPARIRDPSTCTAAGNDHTTSVAGVIASAGDACTDSTTLCQTRRAAIGMAKEVSLFSANFDGILDNYQATFDWGVSRSKIMVNPTGFCTTGNKNIGWDCRAYSSVDYINDRAIDQFDRVIFASSGNADARNNDDVSVDAPAHAANVIAVGGIDTFNEKVWDRAQTTIRDRVHVDSAFLDPSTPHGDRFKPEIVAPFDWALLPRAVAGPDEWAGNLGTSFSSPVGGGIAALMMNQEPVLRYYPETVKAILAASALHHSQGSRPNAWGFVDDKVGAGQVSAAQAHRIISNRQFATGVAKSDFERGPLVFLNQGDIVRIALSWADPVSSKDPRNEIMEADLDLKVFFGSGLVAQSLRYDSTLEVVEFVAPATGNYLPIADIYTMKTQFRYFGLAWSIIKNHQYSGTLSVGTQVSSFVVPDWASDMFVVMDYSNPRFSRLTLRVTLSPSGERTGAGVGEISDSISGLRSSYSVGAGREFVSWAQRFPRDPQIVSIEVAYATGTVSSSFTVKLFFR